MRYGWIPDVPDQRDRAFTPAAPRPADQPTSGVDLRAVCPAIYDQLDVNSCTANALAAAIEFDYLKARLPAFTPSRLFIYYNARVLENSTAADSGAMIRDAIKSIAQGGWCPEAIWPYDEGRFAVAPDKRCYDAGAQHRALSYARLRQSVIDFIACLDEGYPFMFGFAVYDSFESSVQQTGRVAMPLRNEARKGAHAVLCVGYDGATHEFIIRNSWGPAFGVNGYCRMPFAYLQEEDLANDFWTVRVVR